MKHERLVDPATNQYRCVAIRYCSPPDKKYELSLSTYKLEGTAMAFSLYKPNHAARITLAQVPRARKKLLEQMCAAIEPRVDEIFDIWERLDVKEAARFGHSLWIEAKAVIEREEEAKNVAKNSRRLSKSIGLPSPMFSI